MTNAPWDDWVGLTIDVIRRFAASLGARYESSLGWLVGGLVWHACVNVSRPQINSVICFATFSKNINSIASIS